ncbi:RidA family protein [Dethiothermospora halolimnae]|uniref:RidA family protein n=1 Tax=Dethiothermospora halolimnae TaxID=3114390 RepID=UPI003CCB83DF
MSLKAINSSKAPKAVGPYSHSVKVGNLLFISGQLPINPATGEMPEDVQEQTKYSLENCKVIMEEVNATLDDVVKANIYIKDMDQFGKINEVYGEYFKDHKPARACVEVARLPKDALVEIEMIVEVK